MAGSGNKIDMTGYTLVLGKVPLFTLIKPPSHYFRVTLMAIRIYFSKKSRFQIFVTCSLLVLSLLLYACSTEGNALEQEIPLVPLEYVTSSGGVVWLRAPLRVWDSQLQLVEYGADGERQGRFYDEVVFPTDVLVVYSEETRTVSVFLRRSPHGGCLLLWDADSLVIRDPCFGSKFDRTGKYISGPAPRSLDRLSASIRNGMVWLGSEVSYGEPHP